MSSLNVMHRPDTVSGWRQPLTHLLGSRYLFDIPLFYDKPLQLIHPN